MRDRRPPVHTTFDLEIDDTLPGAKVDTLVVIPERSDQRGNDALRLLDWHVFILTPGS